MNRWRLDDGFAIPLVALVCGTLGVLLFVFIMSGVSERRQIQMTFGRVQARYMAQAGMQHALLKLRVLPNESYEAASLARGACPFLPPGQPPALGPAQPCLLQEFQQDIVCDPTNDLYRVPFPESEVNAWSYRVVDMRAMAAEVGGDPNAKGAAHTLEVVVEGKAVVGFKGEQVTRTDVVRRLVRVERKKK